MRLLATLLFFPALCWAGNYDYYICHGPDGEAIYSTDPCGKGLKQKKVSDNTPPTTVTLPAVTGGTVKLQRGRWGNFFAIVKINGTPLRAMIDTGASGVAIANSAANRLNIDTSKGRPGFGQTANGLAPTIFVQLSSVELGGNTYRNIFGNVLSKDMGRFDVLLGMSYLQHFEINTDGHYMTLRPK